MDMHYSVIEKTITKTPEREGCTSMNTQVNRQTSTTIKLSYHNI